MDPRWNRVRSLLVRYGRGLRRARAWSPLALAFIVLGTGLAFARWSAPQADEPAPIADAEVAEGDAAPDGDAAPRVGGTAPDVGARSDDPASPICSVAWDCVRDRDQALGRALVELPTGTRVVTTVVRLTTRRMVAELMSLSPNWDYLDEDPAAPVWLVAIVSEPPYLWDPGIGEAYPRPVATPDWNGGFFAIRPDGGAILGSGTIRNEGSRWRSIIYAPAAGRQICECLPLPEASAGAAPWRDRSALAMSLGASP